MTTEKDIEFNRNYWDTFYAKWHRQTPSQFCVCVITELAEDTVVVELGSGNGRDAHYFASQGYITVATDLSDQAIQACKEQAESQNIDHATFFQGDLTDESSVQAIIKEARILAKNSNVVFYSRFIMHSLDDDQEIQFLNLLAKNMQSDEKIYFEFRSKEDADITKHYKGHFRRYVDTSIFKQRLSNLGFNMEYSITGQGMAKFKEEDPFVSRVIAKKI